MINRTDSTPDLPIHTVLIVSNTPKRLQILRLQLEAEGYDVVDAMHLSTSLDILKQGHPDLVITELDLIDGTGDELCQTIREDPDLKTTPVVGLSVSKEGLTNMLDSGANDCLNIPYERVELLLRVKNQIDWKDFLMKEAVRLAKERAVS